MMQNGVGFFRCSFPNSFFFSFLPTFPKANRTRRITGTSFNTKSRHRSRGPFVSSQIVTNFFIFLFFSDGLNSLFYFFPASGCVCSAVTIGVVCGCMPPLEKNTRLSKQPRTKSDLFTLDGEAVLWVSIYVKGLIRTRAEQRSRPFVVVVVVQRENVTKTFIKREWRRWRGNEKEKGCRVFLFTRPEGVCSSLYFSWIQYLVCVFFD